ncbi:hypothetical protein KCU91_g10091, partial [Aureobasidium melanogenum]
MVASPNSQHQVREQLNTKDNSVMYGAGYALVTVLLIWLDWSGVPTDTAFDITTHWISSLCLLIACFTLLGHVLEALGEAALPDDQEKGKARACIGAILSMYMAILLAILSHCLDNKIFIYKLFWIQVPTLPGAYLATTRLGNTIDGKEQGLKKTCKYGLVDLLLWIHLQNMPVLKDGATRKEDDEYALAFIGFLLGLFILVSTNIVYLIDSLNHAVKTRVAENSKGRVLVTLGASMGIGIMMIGAMVPLELIFHILDGKHWMYQILLAEQGALPGAYLIGGSAWLARTYMGQQSTLPGYSTIDTEEGQK